MKIVYCLPQIFKPGGIERIVSIKANYLAEFYGHEITLVVADQRGKMPYYPISSKVKVIDLELSYDDLLSMPLYKRLVKRRKLQKTHKKKLEALLNDIRPDITVSTFTHEAAFLPDIKDDSKKVLEFHFCRGHKRLMANAFKFRLLTKMAYYFKCWQEENLIIPKFDQFVVLTKEDRDAWKDKVSNVKYIPNILPFESGECAELKNKTVITVGRLDAQKNFGRLIMLWKPIHEACPDWKLNIFGEGCDRADLQQLINELGLADSVFLKGNTSHIKSEYLATSLFVMTSAYEGMPMTMLEAKALGLPVVSFAFPCGPSDLINNGVDGYLVPQNDDYGFVTSMIKVLNDENLRIGMGKKSKVGALEYASDKVMNLWNNLFIELCRKKD